MSSTPKRKKFIKLAKPKHAEEFSMAECAAFQPWKVDLKIDVADNEEPVIYTVFCRAPGPDDAQWTAYHCFMIWEHKRKDIPGDEYPLIHTKQPSEAFRLTEDQYKEFWAEAQKYDHSRTGMRENPSIFRFVKPGESVLPERRRARSTSVFIPERKAIVRPDQNAIDLVTKTKRK